jgi:hypothetical protein
MQWASALLALLKIISALVSWKEKKDAGAAALAQALNKHLLAAQKEIKDAQEIRNAIRADAIARPERLRDNDGFGRD